MGKYHFLVEKAPLLPERLFIKLQDLFSFLSGSTIFFSALKEGENQMEHLTRSQENIILQLIRRGDRVPKIAAIVGVKEEAVEKVLDRYVSREMGWR